MDNYNYPAGSDTPNAPWNEKEPAFKVCPDCEGVSQELSDCCGARMNSDFMMCSDCKDHCGIQVCETCDGEGQVVMTAAEVREQELNIKCVKKYGFLP